MADAIDQEALDELHQRLLAGDCVASEKCCAILLEPLTAETRRKFPKVDPHLVADGVIDAILDYCDHPEKFDPADGRIDRLLAAASWRNVANRLQGEQSRKKRERKVGAKKGEADVALEPVVRKIQEEDQQRSDAKLQAMLDALASSQDREILLLRSQGERRTSEYANVLGITHLAASEQEKEVKRHKDRIIKYLGRKGFKS